MKKFFMLLLMAATACPTSLLVSCGDDAPTPSSDQTSDSWLYISHRDISLTKYGGTLIYGFTTAETITEVKVYYGQSDAINKSYNNQTIDGSLTSKDFTYDRTYYSVTFSTREMSYIKTSYFFVVRTASGKAYFSSPVQLNDTSSTALEVTVDTTMSADSVHATFSGKVPAEVRSSCSSIARYDSWSSTSGFGYNTLMSNVTINSDGTFTGVFTAPREEKTYYICIAAGTPNGDSFTRQVAAMNNVIKVPAKGL